MKSFRKITVKFIALLTAATFVLALPFSYQTHAEETEVSEGLRELGRQLRENMEKDPYAFRAPERRMLRGASVPGSVESFDLRDRNVVTPVKLQDPFGTCWGFAAIAAAETSLISHNNAPSDINLSEKHLTFFTRYPIDNLNAKYRSQCGEGFVFRGPDRSSLIYTGGTSFFATGLFSSGIGPVMESEDEQFEYHGAEKNKVTFDGVDLWYSSDDDWWIDPGLRWKKNYVLKESFILPNPSDCLKNNDTEKWNRAITAMKEELYDGYALQIGFYADTSMPGQSAGTEYISPEWAHYTYRAEGANHSVTVVGWDDNYPKENFAHLEENGTDAPIPDHDGAWLVKNSWGAETNTFPNKGTADWGLLEGQDKGVYDESTHQWKYEPIANAKHTGYFWLSYEDLSIDGVEGFSFDRASAATDYLAQYDFMPVTEPASAWNTAKMSMANVFDISRFIDAGEEGARLDEVSCQTETPGTTVTYDIYRLNANYTDPTDGDRIDHFTKTYKYGGFHKESLEDPVILRSSDKIAVIVTQITPAPDAKYVFSIQYRPNERGTTNDSLFYSKGVINEGESYLYLDEDRSWTDMSNGSVKEVLFEGAERIDMDNFPIKAYLSRVEDPVFPEAEVTPPVAVTGLTYDGSAHVLIEAGSVTLDGTTGTMRYALADETGVPGTYSTTVPEGTDAGNYRVYYKATVNGTDVDWGDVEVSIARKPLESEWSDFTSAMYDGNPHGVSVTLSGKCGSDEVNPVVEGGSQTNAGNYTARLTGLSGAKKDNYSLPTSNLSKNYSITKRSVSLSSSNESKTYDGNALTGGTITRSGDGFVSGEGITTTFTGSRTAPGTSPNSFTYTFNDGTIPGNYNITYTFGNLTVEWWADGERSEHPVTITARSSQVDYSGNLQSVSGFTEDPLVARVGDETYRITGVTAEGSGTNVGTYAVTVSGTPVIWDERDQNVSEHFMITTEPGILEIRTRSVENASISLEDDLRYDGTEQTQRISVSIDGRTLTKDTDYEVSGNRAESAGTHTLTITGKGNYRGTRSKDYDIRKAEITGVNVRQTGTLVYNGSAQTPTISAEADQSGVTFTYARSSDASYTSGIPSFTDAGEYTVYYRAEKSNYASKSGTFKVKIEKAPSNSSNNNSSESSGSGNSNSSSNSGSTGSGNSKTTTKTTTKTTANSSGSKTDSKTENSTQSDKTALNDSISEDKDMKKETKKETKKDTAKDSKTDSKSESKTTFDVAKNTKLDDNEQALKAALGEEKFKELSDSGNTPSVRLGAEKIEEKNVSEEEKKLVEKKIEESKDTIPNLVVGEYLDLQLEVKTDGDWEGISKTKAPVRITIKVPEKLKKLASKFFVMRIHDGETTLFEDADEDEDTVAIDTDLFSTYVLMYQEKEKKEEVAKADPEKDEVKTQEADATGEDENKTASITQKSPDTGSQNISDEDGMSQDMWRIVLFVILVLVIVGLVLLGVYGPKYFKKE